MPQLVADQQARRRPRRRPPGRSPPTCVSELPPRERLVGRVDPPEPLQVLDLRPGQFLAHGRAPCQSGRRVAVRARGTKCHCPGRTFNIIITQGRIATRADSARRIPRLQEATIMLPLPPEWRQAIDEAGGQPVYLEDPRDQSQFLLIREGPRHPESCQTGRAEWPTDVAADGCARRLARLPWRSVSRNCSNLARQLYEGEARQEVPIDRKPELTAILREKYRRQGLDF